MPNRIVKSTSIVEIDEKTNTVKKTVKLYLEHDVVQREVDWLKILKDWDRTPNLLRVDGSTYYMTYEGETLNRQNAPENLKEQLLDIFKGLCKYKVSHNDIKPSDFLVKDDFIKLTDFGWATKKGKAIPSRWPKCIGQNYKPSTGFDDLYSINKIIEDFS